MLSRMKSLCYPGQAYIIVVNLEFNCSFQTRKRSFSENIKQNYCFLGPDFGETTPSFSRLQKLVFLQLEPGLHVWTRTTRLLTNFSDIDCWASFCGWMVLLSNVSYFPLACLTGLTSLGWIDLTGLTGLSSRTFLCSLSWREQPREAVLKL